MQRSFWQRALIFQAKMFSHLYCCLIGQKIRKQRRGRPFSVFLEPARCVAILAPHMDDEIIGCAGLIQQYVRQGTRVIIIYLTDGAHALSGEARQWCNQMRIRESEQSTNLLGIQERFFLQQPDGALTDNSSVRLQLASIFHHEQPGIIYLPYPCDPHSDHQQAFLITKEIIRQGTLDATAFFYQIRVPIPVRLISTILDISSSAALKKQALGYFVSQSQINFNLLLHLQQCQGYLLGWRPRLVEVFALIDATIWKWSPADLSNTGRQILRHRHVPLCF
jgi:LmbE family N-acetylglucosaminyl deacetylase